MKPENYFWKQRNGAFIKVSQMSKLHLENTIKMLRKKGKISHHEWLNYECEVEDNGNDYLTDQYTIEEKPNFNKYIDILEIELRTR